MRRISSVFVLSSALIMTGYAAAENVSGGAINSVPFAEQSLTLSNGRSVPFSVRGRFNTLAVADHDVLDVTPMSDTQILIRGQETGRTNIIAYDEGKVVEVVEVNVIQDLDSIYADLEVLFPNQKFNLRRIKDKIYVEGVVEDVDIEARVLSVIDSYAPDSVINALTIQRPKQVGLKVRFLEAARDDIKQLGLGNFIGQAGDFSFATGSALVSGLAPKSAATVYGGSGDLDFEFSLQALEEKGIIRTLAEPNLVSTSGESASFLAGGEFPVPVAADNDRITIEFREFGVGLDFTPEVLTKNRVSLKVQPEVSQLDTRNSIRLSGFEIPSLIVRKADTTIELRHGQTFAIAGLLQSAYDNDVVQTPVLGDIPVLGSLFRSTRFRENETELIILVTPTLINSADQPDATASLQKPQYKPTESELFFLGLVSGKANAAES